MSRKSYTTNLATSSGPYSHAIDGGQYIFLSGQTAFNAVDKAGLTNDDIGLQTQKCFDHLFDVLKEAGLSPDDVLKVNVYLTTMNHFEAMNEVYEKQFNQPFPARTCVAVYQLPLGAQVEIEFIARRPE